MEKKVAIGMAALMIGTLTACGTSSDDVSQDGTDNFENTVAGNSGDNATDNSGDTVTDNPGDIVTNLDKIDMSKWMYHSGDNVYYQVGISISVVLAIRAAQKTGLMKIGMISPEPRLPMGLQSPEPMKRPATILMRSMQILHGLPMMPQQTRPQLQASVIL